MTKLFLVRVCGALVICAVTVACATAGQNRAQTPDTTPTQPVIVPSTANEGEVPVGQQLDVRLRQPLSSETSQVEDRFEATTLVDLRQGNEVLVPAGSVVRGVVQQVSPAGRLDRTGRLTLTFDEITVRGVRHPIRAAAAEVFKSGGVEAEAGRVGAGAAVGAILGGILGGTRGALAGIVIGGGGVIAATEGENVELPAGSVVRLRFDSALELGN